MGCVKDYNKSFKEIENSNFELEMQRAQITRMQQLLAPTFYATSGTTTYDSYDHEELCKVDNSKKGLKIINNIQDICGVTDKK